MNSKSATQRVYQWINDGTFNPTNGCRHPRSLIADGLGLSEKTISRCVAQLEATGRLRVQRPGRRGECNTYFVAEWSPPHRIKTLARLRQVKCPPKRTAGLSRVHTPASERHHVPVIHSCGRTREAINEGIRMAEATERLRERLEGTGCRVHGRDNDFMAQCPAHEDGKASLHVSEGNNGALVSCHAGCATPDIVDALGLRMADLFDASTSRPKNEIVATYDYTDEHGTLLYQAVRYQPKAFKQRRPDGRGGWLWNIGNTRRVLYRLPAVLNAAAQGDPVYVVEGEKDVQAVEKAGATATTNVGGAAKWRREYGDPLRDANVLIVADRDPAGIDHARRVRAMLAGTAATRRILVPATGKDAHDHLTAGYGLDALEPIDGLVRNDAGWIPCPWCGQTLVEETDGTHCGGCAITWWGER